MIRYREPLFRPPAEADSVIIQAAYGCPHNRCRFCAMYKGAAYQSRTAAELESEVRELARLFPGAMRIFLADGDAMFMKFEVLAALLESLNRHFPALSRVNLYANGSSILAKSPGELRELRALKLDTLYMGMESGDENLLRRIDKGETAEGMVAAGLLAAECGLRMSVMILLGLAGLDGSARHAEASAAAVNRMCPKLLSALRLIRPPGVPMFDGYQPLSEFDAAAELRRMIEEFDLPGTVFRANHVSNPVPMGGRFPRDKAALLADLDRQMASGRLDRQSPGRAPAWL